MRPSVSLMFAYKSNGEQADKISRTEYLHELNSHLCIVAKYK